MGKLLKNNLSYFLRFIFSISLISYIIYKSDLELVKTYISELDWIYLSGAVSVAVLTMLIITFKWQLLLKVKNLKISFVKLFCIGRIGTFFGLFLPSSIGTDAARTYYLIKDNQKKIESVSSVFVERLFGVISLLSFGLLGIMISGEVFGSLAIEQSIFILILFVGFSTTIIFTEKVYLKIISLFDIIGNDKIKKKIQLLFLSINEYKKEKKILLVTLLLSYLVQLSRILTTFLISYALGFNIEFYVFVIFIPVVMIILMAPISLGGLGVRESAYILIFTEFGIPKSDALSISLVSTFLTTLLGLSGGLIYLFYKKPKDHQ